MFRQMRRLKQEISIEECRTILNNGKRGVLSLIGDDGYPYGVPLNYVYDPSSEKLYFHSAKEGHKIEAIGKCNKVSFTVWQKERQDENDRSWYFGSVIVFGRGELVTDEKETVEAVRKIGMKYYPSAADVDKAIEKYISGVQIIAVVIEHLTGKRVHEK